MNNFPLNIAIIYRYFYTHLNKMEKQCIHCKYSSFECYSIDYDHITSRLCLLYENVFHNNDGENLFSELIDILEEYNDFIFKYDLIYQTDNISKGIDCLKWSLNELCKLCGFTGDYTLNLDKVIDDSKLEYWDTHTDFETYPLSQYLKEGIYYLQMPLLLLNQYEETKDTNDFIYDCATKKVYKTL